MINKVYEKTKDFIKNNYKILTLYVVILALFLIPLPYYINAPGGLIDISKRIDVENGNKIEGSFNLAYVSEMSATIPTYLISLLNKDWDLVKKEEVISTNETEKDANFRDHILLEEANNDAFIVALNKTGKKYKITDYKVYVTYVMEDANTNLEVGDQVLEINGKKIVNKNDVFEEIAKYNEGDKLQLKTFKNGKEHLREATIIKVSNRQLIGFTASEIKTIDTDVKVTFNFDKNESGPSGGFMMSLAIYNYLSDTDITKGKKIVGTGTIDVLGNVGAIGGVKYKLMGAVKEKADIFMVPMENYEETIKVADLKKYSIKIVGVENFDEAINYLNDI